MTTTPPGPEDDEAAGVDGCNHTQRQEHRNECGEILSDGEQPRFSRARSCGKAAGEEVNGVGQPMAKGRVAACDSEAEREQREKCQQEPRPLPPPPTFRLLEPSGELSLQDCDSNRALVRKAVRRTNGRRRRRQRSLRRLLVNEFIRAWTARLSTYLRSVTLTCARQTREPSPSEKSTASSVPLCACATL